MFNGEGDKTTPDKPFDWSGLWGSVGNVGTGFLTWQQAEEKRKLVTAQTAATEAETRAIQAQRSNFISSRTVAGIPWNIILIGAGLSLVGLVFLNKRNRRRK